jgi:hypothetical protein
MAFSISDVRDDTSALSDAMTAKYLGYAVDSCQMGNYTAMINGLIDVGPHIYCSKQRREILNTFSTFDIRFVVLFS